VNPTGPGWDRTSYKNWYQNDYDSEFNQWFTYNGSSAFHGFFQDGYGAIVVVVDGQTDLGDGSGSTTLSGSVYYKNFTLAPAPQFLGNAGENCWFLLSPSPYECGTFKNSDGKVVTTSALYPTDGYTRLGTFSGLVKGKAFH